MERNVTWEQLQKMRGNTDFWTKMFARMDNNCFIKQAQHYLNNCSFSRHKNTTYDDAIMNTVLPEALKRIAEMESRNKEPPINGSYTYLEKIEPGSVFETLDGVRAVKSEYHYPNGNPECILLASGEYAHFKNGSKELVKIVEIK